MIVTPALSLELLNPKAINDILRELLLDTSPVLRLPKRVDAFHYPDVEWVELKRTDGSVADVIPRVRGVKALYTRAAFPFESRPPVEGESDEEREARRQEDLEIFRQVIGAHCKMNTESIGRLLGLSLMAGEGGDSLVGIQRQIRCMVRLSPAVDDLMLRAQIERMVYQRSGTHVIVGREVMRRLQNAFYEEMSFRSPSVNNHPIQGATLVVTNDASISHTITVVNADEWAMHEEAPLTFEPLPYDPERLDEHSFLLKTFVASMLTDTYRSHGMIVLN
jgi:hypothetical protein